MTRRRRRGIVTLDTLIEAARKVKRPNLRQLRRNGEVPKGEMVELLAEACGVQVDEIREVGNVAKIVMDPNADRGMFERLFSTTDPFALIPGVNGVAVYLHGVACMNPSVPMEMMTEHLRTHNYWRFVVRNPSLFFATMSDPDYVWNIVRSAKGNVDDEPIQMGTAEERFSDWVDRFGEEERSKWWMAFWYAVHLYYATMSYEEEEALQRESYEKYHSWPERPSLSIATSSVVPRKWQPYVDWPAHARVINLILPYFEQIRDLKLLR